MDQIGKGIKMSVILEIGKGVKCINLPKAAQQKIKNDLCFDNPEYIAAMKQGRFISADMPSHIHLYYAEGNTFWIPRGYIYYLRKWLRINNHLVQIKDYTLLLKPLNLKFNGKLRSYQKTAQKDVLSYPVGVLEAATGCLTGDTLVRVNRAKKGFQCTLKKLYERHNAIVTKGVSTFNHKINGQISRNFYHKQWDLSIPTFIRSYHEDENQILLTEIQNVIYSGIKKVYEFTLEDGKRLKGTLKHKILTTQGWKKLGEIKKNDLVMVDSHRPQKGLKTNNVRTDKSREGLIYHPNTQGNKLNRRTLHILIYEAYLNKLSLEKFIQILKTDSKKAQNLKFVDSEKYHIHHKDQDWENNDPTNLEQLTILQHKKIHIKQTKKNFNQGKPQYVRIIKKKYLGKKETYDICCKSPHNNFTANDIVVHNSGKTVTAISIIVKRKQPTLIIVHSKELLYQWRDAIKQFTDEDCGLIGDGKFQIKPITVGIINTVKKNVPKLEKQFGQIIMDECHRIVASSWSETIQEFPAKHYLGLTATPFRRDGLGHAIFACIGPKRHKVDKSMLFKTKAVLKPDVYKVLSNFRYVFTNDYSTMITNLTQDNARNNLIVSTIVDDLKRYNENILIVSDRKNHLLNMQEKLYNDYKLNSLVLTGSVSKKERTETIEQVKSGKCKILFATLSLIGEGFDAPDLTTLIITTPVKFSGRLIQACGRVLRPKKGKIPRIYDIRDPEVSVLRYSGFARDRIYISEWG